VNRVPVARNELRRSVIAVPPLARDASLEIVEDANAGLVRYLVEGGVRTILYGGNANLYDVRPSDYARFLELVSRLAPEEVLVIPSVGPAFGTMMDQLDVLAEYRFPTVMILPPSGTTQSGGVATAIRRFAEGFGGPVILYVKREDYLEIGDIEALDRDGYVLAIKYAIVRNDPSEDTFLRALCGRVDPAIIISGMGERPAIEHLTDFGLSGFTSGSVCIAPRSSMALLRAVQQGDLTRAAQIRSAFIPLEDLRDALGPIRVLHSAVTLAGISDMGPVLPVQLDLTAHERALVRPVARELRALEEGFQDVATWGGAGAVDHRES
jgi:dihydrodipicolinate synthase/N-acetylneuraminate lyase